MLKIRNIPLGVYMPGSRKKEWIGDAIGAAAGIFGSILGSSSVNSTNETNRQIAEQNNALQRQMFYENLGYNTREAERARDFNHTEALLNRDFQAEQAQINREWESIGSQVQRAYDQGINPQAILTGGMGSTPVQPTSQVASGPAASNSSLPHLVSPTMQNAETSMLSLGQVGKLAAEIENLHADAKAKEAQASNTDIQNKYLEDQIKSTLKVNDAEANRLAAEVNKINASIDEIRAETERIRVTIPNIVANTTLQDRQRIGEELKNFFAGDMYHSIIDKNNADSYRTYKDIDIAYKRLAIEQTVGSAQVGYFGALKDYYGALVEQTSYQNKYYTGMTNLLHWQSNRERQNYLLDSLFGAQERRQGLETGKYGIKQLDYQTGSWYRFTQGWKDILSPVGGIVGGAAGAYVGAKGRGGFGSKPQGVSQGIWNATQSIPNYQY